MFKMWKPLPEVHGLLDKLTFVLKISDLWHKARESLNRLGLENVELPCSPFAAFIEIPQDLVRDTWETFSPPLEWYGELPPERIRMMASLIFDEVFYALSPLDDTGKLAPMLWVKRDQLPKTHPPSWLQDEHCIGLFAVDPTLSADTEAEDGICWSMGNAEESNPWWRWDVIRAHRVLSRLSSQELISNTGSKKGIVKSGSQTRSFWQWEWLMRPVICSHWSRQRGVFPHPELSAVPFYRAQDVKTALEAIVQSHLCIPLLADITDKSLYVQGAIAGARRRLGYPRPETRGRRSGRNPILLNKIKALIQQEGMTKYRAAKILGIARSTLCDYLKDQEADRVIRQFRSVEQ